MALADEVGRMLQVVELAEDRQGLGARVLGLEDVRFRRLQSAALSCKASQSIQSGLCTF
jgi:hypothetical protein